MRERKAGERVEVGGEQGWEKNVTHPQPVLVIRGRRGEEAVTENLAKDWRGKEGGGEKEGRGKGGVAEHIGRSIEEKTK